MLADKAAVICRLYSASTLHLGTCIFTIAKIVFSLFIFYSHSCSIYLQPTYCLQSYLSYYCHFYEQIGNSIQALLDRDNNEQLTFLFCCVPLCRNRDCEKCDKIFFLSYVPTVCCQLDCQCCCIIVKLIS